LHRRNVAYLAGEADFIAGDLAPVFDAEVIPLNADLFSRGARSLPLPVPYH